MSDIDALFKRAEEAFQRKNFDYARDLFLNILTLDPNHEKARESLYATCVKKHQETGGPGKLKLTLMQGKIHMELAAAKSNFAKKMELAQKYLCEDPQNSKVRTTLAECLKSQGLWNGAAAEARLATAADHKNLQAAKILVESLVKLDRITDAQKHLEKISIFVQDDRDLMKLQRDLAAKQTMSKGFEDAAASKEGYRGVLKDSDKAAELERAQRMVVTEEDLQRLVKLLQAAMEDNPADASLPKRIGDLYFEKKKDFAEAREWYRKASQLAPHDSVLKDKVDDCSVRILDTEIDAAAKTGNPKLAEMKVNRLKFLMQSFERRVEDRPTDMSLRFELGKVYYVVGLLDRAIGEFQQSVKDPKRKRDSHIYLGMGFQKKRLYDMADTQYRKAEEEGGSVLTQATLLSIWYNRAICLAEAGKTSDAVELGKKIMEQDISYRDVSQLVEKWSANGAKQA
ncbi:MAG: hypothetical protein HY716_06570 [Planctomycetes bacterium]|nr:hypothetical protein [Planctomycetota bacterium]